MVSTLIQNEDKIFIPSFFFVQDTTRAPWVEISIAKDNIANLFHRVNIEINFGPIWSRMGAKLLEAVLFVCVEVEIVRHEHVLFSVGAKRHNELGTSLVVPPIVAFFVINEFFSEFFFS